MKFLNTFEFKGALGQTLWLSLLFTSKFSNYGWVWGRRQWCTMKKHMEDMQNLRAVGGEKFSYKRCINHPNSSNAFCVGFCRRTDALQVAFPALCLAPGRWWANEWLNGEVHATWWSRGCLLPPLSAAWRSFPMSQLLTSGGQSIGVSVSTSVLPMNTQDWSPLERTGWISLQSKGLSRVFSNTTVQKHQFFGTQLSL